MLVKDIMTPHPFHVSATDSVAKAVQLMQAVNIKHLLVIDRGILIGILSVNDIPTYIKPQLSVFDIMTPNPICIESSADVNQAIHLIITRKIASIPVVDNGHLVGIVTLKDLSQINLLSIEK